MLKKEKAAELEKLKGIVEQYDVIGIINMHSMPTRQLQEIREKLRGRAVIRMSKISLMRMALEQSKKKNMEKLLEHLNGEAAFLLTNENPFLIFRFLKNNRAPATAKTGQTAPKDIIIPKGPTPLAPGPAISSLQKLALKTTVQGGKIAISQDKLVVKAGEVITSDMVGVFSLLKIEPMEIGLDMVAAWEKEFVFIKAVLDTDIEKIISEMQHAIQHAINISIHTGYITSDTAPLALMKAFLEAKSLAIHTNFISPETIGDVMAKAIRECMTLEKNIQNKS